MATFALPRRNRTGRINPRAVVAAGIVLVVFVAAMIGYLLGQQGNTATAVAPTAPAGGPAPVATNHTKTGAGSAAVTAIERLYGPDFVYPQTRDAALKAIADPARYVTLKTQLDGQLQIFNSATHFDSIVKSGTPAVSVMQALAKPDITDYNGTTAQVRFWCMDILGSAGGAPPRVGWNVATVGVRWINNAWKVDTVSLDTGPAPAPDLDTNPPTEAGSFVAQVHQYQGVSK
jgi:hypothetical protein